MNTGPVVAGSIGGGGRLNFSVIGDAVNVAARVEAATREVGEDVLITERTLERLTSRIEVVDCGERELKGIDEPLRAVRAARGVRRAAPGRGAAVGRPARPRRIASSATRGAKPAASRRSSARTAAAALDRASG